MGTRGSLRHARRAAADPPSGRAGGGRAAELGGSEPSPVGVCCVSPPFPAPRPQRLGRATLVTQPATPALIHGQGVKIHKEEKKRIIYIKSLSDLKATQTAP